MIFQCFQKILKRKDLKQCVSDSNYRKLGYSTTLQVCDEQ